MRDVAGDGETPPVMRDAAGDGVTPPVMRDADGDGDAAGDESGRAR